MIAADNIWLSFEMISYAIVKTVLERRTCCTRNSFLTAEPEICIALLLFVALSAGSKLSTSLAH